MAVGFCTTVNAQFFSQNFNSSSVVVIMLMQFQMRVNLKDLHKVVQVFMKQQLQMTHCDLTEQRMQVCFSTVILILLQNQNLYN